MGKIDVDGDSKVIGAVKAQISYSQMCNAVTTESTTTSCQARATLYRLPRRSANCPTMWERLEVAKVTSKQSSTWKNLSLAPLLLMVH